MTRPVSREELDSLLHDALARVELIARSKNHT